jgi:hypothetical protein
MEDAVSKYEEVDNQQYDRGCQIHELSGDAKRSWQNVRGRSGNAVLSSGDEQVAASLMMKRKRELLVMDPHEQTLQREVDDDPQRKADRQCQLKG